MIGPGKYDNECTLVRELTLAQGVMLIVAGGTRGSGFSVQTSLQDFGAKLPGLLRVLALQIEADLGPQQTTK